MTMIEGHADAAYAPLADQFARNFSERGERGASFSVLVDGDVVVDLWGGSSDVRSDAPWQRDTLSVIFSCTKGLMTICALNLVAEGRLDLDAPVVEYWPEFGQSGKDGILVKWLLQHRAGLISFDRDLTLEDVVAWEPVIRAIEEQQPLWTPNAGYRYHTLTHGWLVGELIRRITGETPGAYLRSLTEAIAPSTWLGLPASEQHRVARLTWEDEENGPTPELDPATASREQLWEERAATLGGAFPNSLVFGDRGFNDPRIQAAQAPGAGGVSNARDLASIWSSTVAPTDGVRLLSRELTDAASVPASFGPSILGNDVAPYNAWGTGFQVSSERTPLLSPASFGHGGMGGQAGFADPDARVGFAYVTNHLVHENDTRSAALVETLRGVLG